MAELERLLRQLEDDMAPAAAEPYIRLAASYMRESGNRCAAKPVPAPMAVLARLLDGSPPRAGRPNEEVLALLEEFVVPNSNWLYHPRCVGHQVSAPVPAAVWAEPIVGALNQSMAVREMSPTASALEIGLVRWMSDLAGFGPEAGGVFTSGGTEATFTALLSARARAHPDAWEEGITAGNSVVVAGEHAHYSVARAVAELGLGSRNCHPVPASSLREDSRDLERVLDRLAGEGKRVMAVVATAGSTTTGWFDDLDAVGRICEERGIWVHVDGCHGASALLSARHRHRLKGLQRASSLSWDPHKMMLQPLSTSLVLVRNGGWLEGAFTQRAPYLFHDNRDAGERDQGVRSFQCSRRADVLKFWVSLVRYGTDAFGLLYDHLCDTAAAIHRAVATRPEFEAGPEPESNILCFRYVGSRHPDDPELDTLNASLRVRLNESGHGWMTAARLGGRQVLRMAVMNPRTLPSDGEAILDALQTLARQ
jgi:L-2,4-diaminobutyrate decarboxylase